VGALDVQPGKRGHGIRRFDPYRDLRAVANLMVLAFADRMDPASQLVLADIQRMARRSLLFHLLTSDGGEPAPGFVWVEDGAVVGNVSLKRVAYASGYLVGNVAVHPAWRRRGIGSALMRAALDEVAARGGRWVGLEVQADNIVARDMYARLGFAEAGRTVTLLRPPGEPPGGAVAFPPLLRVRRASARDGERLAEMARAFVPEPQRPYFDLRRANYRVGLERSLACYLEGRREAWWVVEEGTMLCGAVRALRERGRSVNRLEVLVGSGYAGRVEAGLVRLGLTAVRGMGRKMVEASVPECASGVVQALEEAGFRVSHVLVQMHMAIGPAADHHRGRT
jgi:ribosomal protein S18 acetylase RimI-like enzyme